MDRDRFDALARLLASKPSRRSVLAVFLSSAILRHGSPILAEPGGKRPGKQCTPGTDSDSCDNYRYPVSNTVSGKVTYEREVCCNNGFCSCGGDCNCGDACFQTGRERTPERVFCCTEPGGKICGPAGDETCCERELECQTCADLGAGGITGSYRRR
jgi:hypothetical protein